MRNVFELRVYSSETTLQEFVVIVEAMVYLHTYYSLFFIVVNIRLYLIDKERLFVPLFL